MKKILANIINLKEDHPTLYTKYFSDLPQKLMTKFVNDEREYEVNHLSKICYDSNLDTYERWLNERPFVFWIKQSFYFIDNIHYFPFYIMFVFIGMSLNIGIASHLSDAGYAVNPVIFTIGAVLSLLYGAVIMGVKANKISRTIIEKTEYNLTQASRYLKEVADR